MPQSERFERKSSPFSRAAPRDGVLSVAAVLPVADRPELLAEALASIGAGAELPEEIVVVQNARDPQARARDRAACAASFSELERVFQKRGLPAGRLRLREILCETPGPAAARNAGVFRLESDADWIAFLDSDDLWTPQKLARQRKYLAARPHLQLCHTREVWLKTGVELVQPKRLQPRTGRFFRDSLRWCLISCSSLLIRRDLFERLGGFDESFSACEDFELWLRILLEQPAGLVDEALTIKRAGGWPQLSQQTLLDELRIRAICKTVASNGDRLTPQERLAARAAALEKLAVLDQGARKRRAPGRFQELEREIETCFAAYEG